MAEGGGVSGETAMRAGKWQGLAVHPREGLNQGKKGPVSSTINRTATVSMERSASLGTYARDVEGSTRHISAEK